ncbi:immunoglobulin superfamily member 6 [Dendrobates tinctorius]|uniref:immunoglobulin superfamily member 6 n=1 Tax=Dendrobates tinctorius TaxID=92724 RepID=UPI003CC9AA83
MARSHLSGCMFLQFILTYCYSGAGGCAVEVTQKPFSEALLEQKTANVSCGYKAKNCPGTKSIFWFRYLASTYEILNPGDGNRFKVENNAEISLLKIEQIVTEDSGIYICGLVFPQSSKATSKAAGQGTTLIIREKADVVLTPTNIALMVLCTLTLIYCIAAFFYYSFKAKWRMWKCLRSKRGVTMRSNRTFKTRSIFQAIAAEYHKRYPGKTRKPNQVIEDEQIYQNTQDLD